MLRRYELTDEEWLRIEPLLPPENTGKQGRPRKDNRIIMNGIVWLARSGAPWRDLPERYGSWKTVYSRFRKWIDDGILDNIFRILSLEAELEELEIKLIHKFSKAHKPILGICRGIQTINVAFNGTLIQDIPETKKYDNHLQENLEGYHHLVKTIPHTKLNKYLGNEFMTNSFHHQAIDDIAPGFVVSAITADGIIEGIEKDNIIAVQWHPEKNHDKIQAGLIKLYKELLEEEK